MNREDRYDSLFRFYGEKHGVDWALLKAIGMQESALNPEAISPVGAAGLMQFMPATWREWADETVGIQGAPLGYADRRNPERSIAAAAAYLARLFAVFGTTERVLAAYNWGWGRVRRWIARGADPDELPAETRHYIRKVPWRFDRIRRTEEG